jgi:hypothetical protein
VEIEGFGGLNDHFEDVYGDENILKYIVRKFFYESHPLGSESDPMELTFVL